MDRSSARATIGMGAAFVLVMPFAVWLARPFQAARPTELPQDPTDPVSAASIVIGGLVFVALAIAMAAFVIWAVRTGRQKIIQGMVLTAVAVALVVVLARPALWLVPYLGEDLPWLLALAVGGGLAVLLGVRPSWPLINAAAFLVSAGVAALAGAVLGITPLLLLLVFIAVYDHVAVRRTKHMMKLARAATDLRLPIAMQFGGPPMTPRRRPRPDGQTTAAPTAGSPGGPASGAAATTSATSAGTAKTSARPTARPADPNTDHPTAPAGNATALAGEPTGHLARAPTAPRARPRTQILMGIGDLVFPTALVVAAADPAKGWGLAPAAVAGLGVFVAYLVLVRQALRGKAQPGLPYLNAGAVIGFLAGLGAATGSLVFW